jgi:molybdopterin converting factor small subunit
MIEIRFKDQHQVTDLAGRTVSEAREQLRKEFNIPDRATIKLNGTKVNASAEFDTVLNDDDKITFTVSRGVGAYLVGAALLALAVTGGVFAFGFINATTSLNATTVNSNFADVTANATGSANVTWNAYGFFKGSIGGPNTIFNITPAAGYTGDLVTTVTVGNADDLVKRYRVLALQLEMVDEATQTVLDINESGTADANDWVMLSLDNGSVSLFTDGSASMSLRVKRGFYITHVHPFGGWQGSATPELFCEVAQR